MSARPSQSWLDVNRRHLAALLARVRTHLERAAARAGKDAKGRPASELHAPEHVEDVGKPESSLAPPAAPTAIDVVCDVFGLSGFERDILLLCAGFELDRSIAAAAALHGADTPTFGLALGTLPEAAWGPLAPDAPLRRWHLIELGPGDTLITRPIRIDEFILHFLLGVVAMDERLVGMAQSVEDTAALPPSSEQAAIQIAEMWMASDTAPVMSLCGPATAAMRAVAAHACRQCNLGLHAINAADLPDAVADQLTLARLWERHAALTSSALLIETGTADSERRRAASLAARTSGFVLVAAPDPMQVRDRDTMRVDVTRPLPGEQRGLWDHALGPLAGRLAAGLDVVAAQFHLEAADIAAIAARVRSHAGAHHGEVSMDVLWSACRAQARPRLDDLAQYIEARASWDDLVLDERQRGVLRDVVAHVHQREHVYQRWGFAVRSARGLGISAMFAGPSGTGKTTAAEVLARELKLDLFRIDLSAVVSKYIGETEKNLRAVFDAAESGSAILLFDEADALFGKRSDVKDSHDRYANMEVSYLLQRMEAYRGLAILTTNLRDSIDEAFLRRIRFVVDFPFPSREQRVAIWARMFPAEAPTRGLDMNKLARLDLAGGSIRNVALASAFLAAYEGEPIQMRHVRRAARTELAKLERPIHEHEMRDWQ